MRTAQQTVFETVRPRATWQNEATQPNALRVSGQRNCEERAAQRVGHCPSAPVISGLSRAAVTYTIDNGWAVYPIARIQGAGPDLARPPEQTYWD